MKTIMNDSIQHQSYTEDYHGEANFVERLVEYVDMLHAVALHLTHDPQRAEALVRKTLATALRERHALTEDMYLKSWLLTILRTAFIKPGNPVQPVRDCSGSDDGSLSYYLDLKKCSLLLLSSSA